MFSQVCLQGAKITEQRQPANKGRQRAFGESVQGTRNSVVRLTNLVYVVVNFLSQVIFVFLLFFGYGNVC